MRLRGERLSPGRIKLNSSCYEIPNFELFLQPGKSSECLNGWNWNRSLGREKELPRSTVFSFASSNRLFFLSILQTLFRFSFCRWWTWSLAIRKSQKWQMFERTFELKWILVSGFFSLVCASQHNENWLLNQTNIQQSSSDDISNEILFPFFFYFKVKLQTWNCIWKWCSSLLVAMQTHSHQSAYNRNSKSSISNVLRLTRTCFHFFISTSSISSFSFSFVFHVLSTVWQSFRFLYTRWSQSFLVDRLKFATSKIPTETNRKIKTVKCHRTQFVIVDFPTFDLFGRAKNCGNDNDNKTNVNFISDRWIEIWFSIFQRNSNENLLSKYYIN